MTFESLRKQKINAIRRSEEVGVRYMNAWEERLLDKKEAREEGFADGRKEGFADGRKEGLADGSREAKLEIARRMRAAGMTDEEVQRLTALTDEEMAAV